MPLVTMLRRCHLVVEGIASAYCEADETVATGKWAQAAEEARTVIAWIEEHWRACQVRAD